uniref:Uncharacterized protein n=1 Tax=Zea mays TaxID=4577 RepID=A0A804NK03_MAIZE
MFLSPSCIDKACGGMDIYSTELEPSYHRWVCKSNFPAKECMIHMRRKIPPNSAREKTKKKDNEKTCQLVPLSLLICKQNE